LQKKTLQNASYLFFLQTKEMVFFAVYDFLLTFAPENVTKG